MLNGREFGEAIATAIARKLKNGSVKSKAEIARHFKIKPPSLVDWVKKGSVSKDKLPEIWRYFSDVAGPEHWGMSIGEWPSELSKEYEEKPQERASCTTINAPTQLVTKSRHDHLIDEILALLQQTDLPGLAVILDRAKDAARDYPMVKQTQKSSV